MERLFIELTAQSSIESCRALGDVARLCIHLSTERQLHSDFIDEREHINSHEWCYLVLMIYGTSALILEHEIRKVSSPFVAELRSLFIYKDTGLPQSNIAESSLVISYYRHDRPSNQFIAYGDSNVVIQHLPSGITVRSQNERSRPRNYTNAMCFLRAKLNEEMPPSFE